MPYVVTWDEKVTIHYKQYKCFFCIYDRAEAYDWSKVSKMTPKSLTMKAQQSGKDINVTQNLNEIGCKYYNKGGH